MSDGVGRKVGFVAGALAAAVGADLAASAATEDTAQAEAAPPPPEGPPEPPAGDSGIPDWHPTSETTTVTHGPDGSVGASHDTVFRPDSAPPGADVPTIEEFEQIEVHEDAFGNFVIDATERVVVHDHGHDQVFEDHQHIVVPGDGTPGDTDLDITEREHVVVHTNPDGTISVDESHELTVETHPDTPGHGDVDVWQEESVTFAHGQPNVGVTEQEQANVDDPFGEADTVRQDERVGGVSIMDRPPAGHDPAEVTGPAVTVHTASVPAVTAVTPVVEPHHDTPEPPQLHVPEPHEQPESHHYDAAEADPAPVHHDHLDHTHGG